MTRVRRSSKSHADRERTASDGRRRRAGAVLSASGPPLAASASTLFPAGGLVRAAPLHGGAVQTPVPHWAVLLAVVPALWLLIAAAVVAVDRLHRRLLRSRSPD